jgi:Zn-dependent protease with chaperone function
MAPGAWFLAWRQEVELSADPAELATALPGAEEAGDLYATDAVTFEQDRTGLFDIRYRWRVSTSSAQFNVVEAAYVSRWWFLLLAVSIVGGLSVVGSRIVGGAELVAVGAVTVASLAGFAGLIFWLFRASSELEEVFQEATGEVTVIPIASLLIPVTGLVLLLYVVDRPVTWVGVPAVIVALVAGYGVFHRRVEQWSISWQSTVASASHQVPVVAGNYCAGMLLAMIPPGVFVAIYDQPITLYVIDSRPVAATILLGGVFAGMSAVLLQALRNGQPYESRSFKQQGQTVENVKPITATGIAVVAVSVGFGVLAFEFLTATYRLLTVFPLSGGIVLAASLPILYVGGGLCYQVVDFSRWLVGMLRRAEPQNIPTEIGLDAPTYVLDVDYPNAGALSIGPFEAIVVSNKVVDELQPDELEAVLAHEEAHLRTGDAGLASAIAILSPLVFTGKNVLYSVAGYRDREFRADRLAAERIDDPEALHRALDTLQRLRSEEGGDGRAAVPTFLSFRGEDDAEGVLDRLFGFYYDSFTATEAHPSLSERKHRIRKQES